MGEEKKEENTAAAAAEEKKAVEEKKEEKKEEVSPPLEIVLKVDMHCEACAKKVVRALKGFQGVDEVKTDSKTNKVVVKGKGADPIKVCERLQKKSGRKVELISPLPPPPPPPQPEEEEKKKEEEEKKQEKEEDKTKKEEPPVVVTIVLNVRMHCEACAQVLQKRIRKIQGIESVETNLASDQVTVKGVIEPEKLVDYVYKRTGKQATVVKKEEEKKKDDKKESEKAAEKKESEEAAKGETANEEEEIVDMMKRSEYWPSKPYSDQYSAYPPHPQIFSDENPNACSLM